MRRLLSLPDVFSLITALAIFLILGKLPLAHAQTEEIPPPPRGPAVLVALDGPIGPATDDHLGRALRTAADQNAEVIIIRMDTPGGLDTSMRAMIGKILASPIPIAVFVAPEGARAASAGTFILYAAHVAAMAPATSVGAATPVQMGGGGPSPGAGDDNDGTAKDGERLSAMERKVINDAVSYVRGLAELRGRNPDWAEEAVRQGASLTSSAALEKNVIDFLVPDVATLLEQMDGHTVEVLHQQQVLQTRGLQVEEIHPDWRTQLLGVITNPNVAFILMLVGVYGLIFELANPGAMVPGIAGAISLLLALFAFHLLPINYAGVALIGFGIILMGAEAFAPSFGALGIGGIVAFVLGSIILIEGDIPGFELYLSVILSFAVVSALVLVLFVTMALRAFRLPRVSGREGLVGSIGTATESFDSEGHIQVLGELWKAQSSRPVVKGQPVKVTAVDSLLLAVEPANPKPKPHAP